MSNDTTHTPADVRERVAKEVYLWEATRFGADASWALRRWREESDTRRELYFNVADRILALLRTPRGEGETMDADAMWYHWSSGHEDAALQGLRTATDDEGHRFLSMLADWQRCPKPSDHDALAALRSDAQGEVWREVDDLLARLERFEHDAAGESEAYWRVVAMRDRIAAARRSEGGGA